MNNYLRKALDELEHGGDDTTASAQAALAILTDNIEAFQNEEIDIGEFDYTYDALLLLLRIIKDSNKSNFIDE